MNPLRFIEKMMISFKWLFGVSPKGTQPKSPFEEGDHPELDSSEFLDDDSLHNKIKFSIRSLKINLGQVGYAYGSDDDVSSSKAQSRIDHIKICHAPTRDNWRDLSPQNNYNTIIVIDWS